MKVLVIGGAGYIGSALSIMLSNTGHDVTVIDPQSPQYLFPPEITHVKGKYQESWLHKNAKYDVVYHLGAIASIEKCEQVGPKAVTKENVGLTKDIVDHISPDTILIHASSSAVYANPSLYSISKLQSEYLVTTHPNNISLRLGTVYGLSPNMRDGVLVNDMVKEAVTTGVLRVWHGFSQRPYIHIDDLIKHLSTFIDGSHLPYIENVSSFTASKEIIAFLIHEVTGCKLEKVKKSARFIQNFHMPSNVIIGRSGIQVKDLVDYYETR